MKKTMILLIGAITLSGCAGKPLYNQDELMSLYQGKHISSIVNKIGLPDTEETIMNRKVYTWKGSYAALVSNGGGLSAVFDSNFQIAGWKTNSTSITSHEYSCSLKVNVNEQEYIRGYRWLGNDCNYLIFNNLFWSTKKGKLMQERERLKTESVRCFNNRQWKGLDCSDDAFYKRRQRLDIVQKELRDMKYNGTKNSLVEKEQLK